MSEVGLTDKQRIALKIVNLAKAQALVDNHFLSAAIGRLAINLSVPVALPFATNAREIFVNADLLCEQFKTERTAPARDLMHPILHCIFLHPYIAPSVNRQLWNLACDIVAEKNVANLCGPRGGQRGKEIGKAITIVERGIKGTVTAEKIYQALCAGKWAQHVDVWEAMFVSDDHSVWYAESEGSQASNSDESQPTSSKARQQDDSEQSSSESGSHYDENQQESLNEQGNCDTGGNPAQGAGEQDNATGSGQSLGDNQGERSDGTGEGDGAEEDGRVDGRNQNDAVASESESGGGSMPQQPNVRQNESVMPRTQHDIDNEKAEWRRVAKSLAMNLQTYCRERGTQAGSLIDELEISALEKVDYGDFLRRFAVMSEVMRLSDDEFDYVFYTYGLKLYGNMPLIEPLEYREDKRIRDFAIVIDTSGSVYGKIVKRFVDITFDILKSTEAFAERMRVHIIQCDAEVQSDDVITSLDELQEWGNTFKLRGCGGTDFRPAFAYVDKLVADGEFANLNGLIYFTDGWGKYPDYVPEYKTAFVFYDSDFRPENVPPWAIQVVLDDMVIKEAIEEASCAYIGRNYAD